MRLRPAVLVLVVACAAVLVSASPAAPATSQPEPVPSLEPEATRALWERLSRRKIDFRPLEAQHCLAFIRTWSAGATAARGPHAVAPATP